MTPEKAKRITQTSTRCTQAVLRAFDIEGYPYYGTGVLEYLKAGGLDVRCIDSDVPFVKWMKEKHEGSYVLFTKGHALAVVNGVVIDTARTKKGKIEFVWQVLPK